MSLKFVSALKVYTGTQTFCEGCECKKNGIIQRSHFIHRKFAKKLHAGSEAPSIIVRGMRETFEKFQTFLKCCRTKNERLATLPKPRASLSNFWSIKCECWTLPFFRYLHPSQNVRLPVKSARIKFVVFQTNSLFSHSQFSHVI